LPLAQERRQTALTQQNEVLSSLLLDSWHWLDNF